MNKFVKVIGGIVLSVGILSACGQQSPTDTVNSFTSAFQKDDLTTAFTFVDGKTKKVMDNSGMTLDDSDKAMQEILKAESTGFKVNSITDKGKNTVEIDFTGKDFGKASTKAIQQIMPTAFATAFSSSNKKQSQQAIQDMMIQDIVDNLNAKDAPTVEKKVTLQLKKNKDGKYLIEPNNNLADVLMPNYDEMIKLFNASPNAGSNTDAWVQGQDNSANGQPASSDPSLSQQPAETISVVKDIATNKAVNMNPINLTLDDVAIKQATNVPQDEVSRVNGLGYNVTGDSFNYISIKYTATSTSPKNIDFYGVTKVVVIAGSQQEVLGTDKSSIVTDNPNYDGVFYGQVTKQGNEGFITSLDPSKITKIIVTVNGTMEDKVYDTITADTDLTFTPQQ